MSKPSKPYRIAVAGTTERTVQCATALLQSPDFEIPWVLTPAPKPIGRKQTITPNPLHNFANNHSIPSILVETTRLQSAKAAILAQTAANSIDFLLVVDFGYLIPQWLLSLPTISPVNIHPSALPRWRGSAPGQFALLFGETQSAVTLMVMDSELDHGPLIASIPFTVGPTWNAFEYYRHSFDRIIPELPKLLTAFAQTGTSTPQPDLSPTPLARKIEKNDAYIPWQVLKAAMHGGTPPQLAQGSLLAAAQRQHSNLATLLEHAVRAFNPWPVLWTKVHTKAGEKRLKIFAATTQGTLFVPQIVQFESKNQTSFTTVKDTILD